MTSSRGPSRFILEASLGEGGFCSVQRATDSTNGTTVALKFLRRESDTPEHRDALRQEFQILSHLRHPNLIEALGFGVDSQLGTYVVLEHFEGESLRRFCTQAKQDDQVEAIVQLCRALNFLHARGIVHGDLKPDNVLVAQKPVSLSHSPAQRTCLLVKLIDLGLASRSYEGNPLPRRGTPSYVAPEVLAGMPADHRADLYSLGVLILDAILPYSIVTRAIQPAASQALDDATKLLPLPLAAVTRCLLQVDPERRPATASDVIEILSCITDQAIPIETLEGIRASLHSIGVVARNTIVDEIVTAWSPRPEGRSYSAESPSVFLVHGEAGIGKTALVNTIINCLNEHGVTVHRTTCVEDGATPFHPFRTFLRGHSSSLFSGSHSQQSDAAMSPEPGWGPFDRADRLDQVTQEVASRLASHEGGAIVEDLHLADEETFEVFLRLLPRARSGRFRLIATFRTEGVLGGRLERMLESHFTLPHIRSIRLQRFSLEESEELLRACLGPHRSVSSLATAIHRISEGNPLFLLELLRGLIESGQITGGPFRWKIDVDSIAASGAPRSLRDFVRRRLAALPENTYDVLGWLSVIGHPSGIGLLHEASGLPYAELRRHLSTLLSAGLITQSAPATDDTSWFSHDLYRTSVYEAVPGERRQKMHRSVGVALERLWGEASEEKWIPLAHHFIRGGDETKGPRYAVLAGAHARQRGGFHQAISLYHDALNLLQGAQLELRFEVLEILAGLLRQIGEPARSETYYYEMLIAARSKNDSRREAVALTQIGRILADRGILAEAKAFSERGLEKHCALCDPVGQAESLLVLAIIANKSADNIAALELGLRAKSMAEAAGNRWVYGLSANNVGMALISMRRYEEALPEFMIWLGVAEEAHNAIAQTLALCNIGWALLERGRLQEADTYFRKCVARSVDDGLVYTAGLAGINSSEVARLQGDYELSRERARHALSTMQRAERNDGIQYAIYTLGLLDYEQGALGEAKANLQRALGMSEEVGAKGSAAMTLVAVGDMHLQLGEHAVAEKAYLRAAEGGEVVGDDLIRSFALSGQAEASACARLNGVSMRPTVVDGCAPGGEQRRELQKATHVEVTAFACRLAAEAFAIADRIESPQARVRADLAGSLACLADGRFDEALELANRATSESEKGGLRPGAARARLHAGMIHARAGQLHQAASSLVDACTMADEMGLASVRAQARAELAEVATALNDHARADALHAETAQILHTMASSLPEPSERERFLSVGWRKTALQRAEAAQHRKDTVRSRGPDALRESASESSRENTVNRPAAAADEREASAGRPLLGGADLDGVPADTNAMGGESSAASIRGADEAPQPNDVPLPDPDLRTGVARLLDEALKTTGGDRGLLFLIGPEGGSEIAVARGLESESIDDARSYCRSVIERAAQGEEILAVDTSRDERLRDRRSVSLFHIVSIICVPLKIGPRVTGALYLDSRAGGRLLREDDFKRARDVASRIAGSIRAAWETERRREEHLLKQRTLCQTYRLDAIVGESAAMRKIFRVLEAVIASDCNVLVVGESGTGKELAARAIHFSGRRKLAPFVPLDCGALQDSLVESELFGYRKGAFTGADMDRQGLFEEADGGTLFLDEITNTSMLFQGKLLRVLQSGEFRRVGDSVARRVDVRIIAATNADLEEAIRSGKFREDLYYRLNVVTVRMPPLRERPEDIPALAEQFAKAYCEKEKISYRGIGDSALRRLCEHGWPGNVRELKNAIESALVLSRDGAVRREFLPQIVHGGSFEEIRALLKSGAVELGGEQAFVAGSAADRPAASQVSTSTRTLENDDSGHGVSADTARARSAGETTQLVTEGSDGPEERSADPSRRLGPSGWVTAAEGRALGDDEERSRIEDALRLTGGDKSRAAGLLGWSRMTLYRKMRRLGIDYTTGRTEGPPSA